MKEFTFQGNKYKRSATDLGGMEKVTWFENEQEIFDQEKLEMLELAYETSLTVNIGPILPLI